MRVFRSKLLIVNQETPGFLLQGFGPKVFNAFKYYGQTLLNVEIQFYCSWFLLYLVWGLFSLESITANSQHVKTDEDQAPHKLHMLYLLCRK